MATFTPSVRVIVNGTPVDAATTNGPIADLTSRTDWLKAQLDGLAAGTQLVLRDQVIVSGLVAGDVVYYNDTNGRFEGALADIDTNDLNRASATSFWQGVLQSAAGTVGDVVIGGALPLTQLAWATAFEDGVFAAGDVFLSAVTAGKITTEPGTTGVYLGHMRDSGSGSAELLVRLGSPNSFLDHVHYERSLQGKPAGTVLDPAFNQPMLFDTPDASEQGWLPANSTYFPGFVVGVQIPVGAVFGYNITHPAETSLAEIFPMVPPENAQLEQEGVILDSDTVVTNEYGIWWLDNSYGNAPWPVDYAAEEIAADITLWTTRIIASATIIELVEASILNTLANGGADTLAVTGLLSSNTDDLGVVGTEGDAVDGWKGQVVLTNLGVTALRYLRGLEISAPSGDNITGYKGILDIKFNAMLPAVHQYTFIDPGDVNPDQKLQPVTTNGLSAGTPIGLYGHRLGPETTNDYIDFLIVGGSDLVAGQDYQLVIRVDASVDTPTASPTAADVDVEFYRLIPGAPMGSTQLALTTQLTFNTGVPGQLQQAIFGPSASVVLQQDEQMLVRIRNAAGSPLPLDSFKCLGVYYTMDVP